MKKHLKKWFALALALVMVIGVFAGCGSTKEANTEKTAGGDGPVIIRFLHKGPKPAGWDQVYAKYLEMTKDTLNIELEVEWVEHADYKEKLNLEITSGSDWDLVFEAPWVQLKNLAPGGYYADLSPYFNNPEKSIPAWQPPLPRRPWRPIPGLTPCAISLCMRSTATASP